MVISPCFLSIMPLYFHVLMLHVIAMNELNLKVIYSWGAQTCFNIWTICIATAVQTTKLRVKQNKFKIIDVSTHFNKLIAFNLNISAIKTKIFRLTCYTSCVLCLISKSYSCIVHLNTRAMW